MRNHVVGVGLSSMVGVCGLGGLPAEGAEPDFGPNVRVFDPSSKNAQAEIDAIFATQEKGQFNPDRYALLFKPGKYELNVRVGFYTQVCGLGTSPDGVEIVGALQAPARWMANRNATCNFWRGAENLSVKPTLEGGVNIWAVSQATFWRRVHVKGDVNLWDGGWSSGGFLADCTIDGTINSGSQQQWFSRNCAWGKWVGGNWNMVFVGVTNPPEGAWPQKPYTTIERTPIVRPKPYLFIGSDGKYGVRVPGMQRDVQGVVGKSGDAGANGARGDTEEASIPIDEFYIARSDRDDASSINKALDAGRHLLFTPGVYRIDAPLRVSRAETVVLGIGFPTLLATNGNAVMTLADVDGLKVGALIFEASEKTSPALLEVGERGSRVSHRENPTFLYDITCRAGGAQNGRCESFVTVHSDDVVGENLWLWRADHGEGAKWDSNRNANGLIVHGDNVTMYGLFVEHCHEYQTIWNGENGRVYFYQSEMPYDPPSQEAWMNGKTRGFASYKVADSVKTHEAWGLGVYCVFKDAAIIADSAIEAPQTPGVKLRNMIAVRLSGKPDSGIRSVINDKGEPVIQKQTSRVMSN